jgi:hypothetical protein
MKNKKHFFFLWALVAAAVAGGTFLMAEHLDGGMGTAGAQFTVTAGGGSAPDVQPDAPVPMQNFSNDGYAFSVPASWVIEQTATDTIALHPDAASPDAACKIEVSAFPYSPAVDPADWIAHRIGADPSLAVVEQSSGEVALGTGTGVQWTGTIDGIPTTLVYAFNDDHAYEVAPSVIGGSADGSFSCGDMLQTFLSSFTI